MHQVIIINNNLKMSKGKIARVCAFVTAKLIYNQDVNEDSIYKCVVLKADNYEEIQKYLEFNGIEYSQHIDLGLTCVAPMSDCAISFIYKKENIILQKIDELKLL